MLKKYLAPLIVFFYIKKINIISKVVFDYCLMTKKKNKDSKDKNIFGWRDRQR
jgi:hypothetical protein